MPKKITQFNIDTTNISQHGESRSFSILGQSGAGFFLTIKNEDGSYYNFETRSFQTSETYLQQTIVGTEFSSIISFPPVSDADRYDFFLLADVSLDSEHDNYIEARDIDGSISVNDSYGSNSNLVKKVIYQTLDQVLTIDTVNLSGGSGFNSYTDTTDTITVNYQGSTPVTPFTITITSANGSAFSLARQPVANDFLAKTASRTIGSAVTTGLSEDLKVWELDNVADIAEGMTVLGTNVTANTIVKTSEVAINPPATPLNPNPTITTFVQPAVTRRGPVTITRDGTTNIVTTSFTGNVCFNVAQDSGLADDTDLVFYAWGPSQINTMKGWDISITDLKAEITKPTTTTTSAVSNSTSVPITSARGIMDGDVSSVSSLNIDSTVADPTVTTIGSYNESSGQTATLTLSAAQTLEDGEVLTFDNAGQTITITGNIKVDNADASVSIFLDVSKFVIATVETA